MVKIEYTPGRVAHATILGQRVRIYAKPSLGKTIIRKSGVARKSEKVREINRVVKELKPAVLCKGRDIQKFRVCLSEEMKKALKKV
jgi:hypothetical protein